MAKVTITIEARKSEIDQLSADFSGRVILDQRWDGGAKDNEDEPSLVQARGDADALIALRSAMRSMRSATARRAA